jgi:hypothetical protein
VEGVLAVDGELLADVAHGKGAVGATGEFLGGSKRRPRRLCRRAEASLCAVVAKVAGPHDVVEPVATSVHERDVGPAVVVDVVRGARVNRRLKVGRAAHGSLENDDRVEEFLHDAGVQAPIKNAVCRDDGTHAADVLAIADTRQPVDLAVAVEVGDVVRVG